MAAVIAIGITFTIAWYAFEQFGSCQNVVLYSNRSPDGNKAVFVFRQQCNATVPDSIWASVAMADRPFVPDRNDAFLGLTSGAEVRANWLGNDVVEIALLPGGAPFIKRDERAGTVRINYK
jgi:hypothetical protein